MSGKVASERVAEFEIEFARLRNLWRISEDCGMPESEAKMTWDLVLLEMKFCCSNLDRSLAVAGYARKWVEIGNPYYIDAAVYLCGLEGIAPPETLAKQVAKVAAARFFDKTKAGTSNQILKENARSFAMSRMAKLCAAGASQEEAASKVARLMDDMGTGLVFKASTLEKYYTSDWQAIEADMKKMFADDPEHLAEWRCTLEMMPEADEELKGNRRA